MRKDVAVSSQETNTVGGMGETEMVKDLASVHPLVATPNPYEPIWDGIKRVSPGAILLRGPACLNPIWLGSENGSDIDVLAEEGRIAAVRTFLRGQGFHRVFKPHTYLERYRRWVRGDTQAHTVDLFKTVEWGLGYRQTKAKGELPDERVASLLHAVVDGKGTARFEREHHGPPWELPMPGIGRFGLVGKALWRIGLTSLLTGYLILMGVIRPNLAAIFRYLLRRMAYSIWRLSGRVGMEIAFLGVDGAGKTSVASSLRLPAPAKVIYIYLGMGLHDYRTAPMRFIVRHNFPRWFRKIFFRFDVLVRRLEGWFYSHLGYIVIYDRHPSERLDPLNWSPSGLARNLVDGIFAWRVDWTFWLTGDHQRIYLRKREFPLSDLEITDDRYSNILKHYDLPHDKIDVTRTDLQEVITFATARVLEMHKERVSLDRLANRFLRAFLQ
ncbi:MAG TPA: hypothetical protein VNM47_01085 [Terriglobia bacterium]|nr:hypothetical protein [Terriglobia bacterium]